MPDMSKPKQNSVTMKKDFPVTIVTTVRTEIVERLDAYALSHGISRSAAVRKFIDDGLKAAGKR